MKNVWQISGTKVFIVVMKFFSSTFLNFALLVLVCCANDDARMIQKEVELLVGEPGLLADEAERSLVNRGSIVIPILETGLYIGDVQGRKKVIRVLQKIGDPKGLPIVQFLAINDKESQVRESASHAISVLEREGK